MKYTGYSRTCKEWPLMESYKQNIVHWLVSFNSFVKDEWLQTSGLNREDTDGPFWWTDQRTWGWTGRWCGQCPRPQRRAGWHQGLRQCAACSEHGRWCPGLRPVPSPATQRVVSSTNHILTERAISVEMFQSLLAVCGHNKSLISATHHLCTSLHFIWQPGPTKHLFLTCYLFNCLPKRSWWSWSGGTGRHHPGASPSGTGTSCPYAYQRYAGVDGCI